jgi:broad specificity polyphosphatase/5'/3'-nucleotidase SurE
MATTWAEHWAAALSSMHTTFGAAITYARSSATVSLNAIEIQEDEQIVGEPMLVISFGRSGWIVKGTDLILSGVATTPRRGDTITTAAGTVYEVVEPADSGAVYTNEDPNGIWIRVHTARMQ